MRTLKLATFATLAIVFATSPLLAAAPQQNSPGVEGVMLSYRQMALAIDTMVKEQGQALAEWQAKYQAMDAYLKACGDKPGCTVPLPEPKK